MVSGLVPTQRTAACQSTLLLMLPSAILAAAALLAGTAFAQEDDWNYQNQGRDWNGTCRTGLKQSPININGNSIMDVYKQKSLEFINYDKLTPLTVGVDHHTVRATPNVDYEISITGGGLPGRYILNDIHFHWGSEHLLDGQRFALEAHMVHYNSKYSNSSAAIASGDPNALAVLGILYKETNAWNLEIGLIQKGAMSGKTILNLKKLLPSDKSTFYRYSGSLTTPPCAETVIWTIFTKPKEILDLQITDFKNLLPDDEGLENYRQQQNDQPVVHWSTENNDLESNVIKDST